MKKKKKEEINEDLYKQSKLMICTFIIFGVLLISAILLSITHKGTYSVDPNSSGSNCGKHGIEQVHSACVNSTTGQWDPSTCTCISRPTCESLGYSSGCDTSSFYCEWEGGCVISKHALGTNCGEEGMTWTVAGCKWGSQIEYYDSNSAYYTTCYYTIDNRLVKCSPHSDPGNLCDEWETRDGDASKYYCKENYSHHDNCCWHDYAGGNKVAGVTNYVACLAANGIWTCGGNPTDPPTNPPTVAPNPTYACYLVNHKYVWAATQPTGGVPVGTITDIENCQGCEDGYEDNNGECTPPSTNPPTNPPTNTPTPTVVPKSQCYECNVNGTVKHEMATSETEARAKTGASTCTAVAESKCNVIVNPPTGIIGLVIAWIVGIFTLIYAYWYAKKSATLK